MDGEPLSSSCVSTIKAEGGESVARMDDTNIKNKIICRFIFNHTINEDLHHIIQEISVARILFG